MNATSVAAAEQLPDLGVAAPTNFSIDTKTIPGKRLLRFDTVIVNVGSGAFQLEGTGSGGSMSTVRQRIFDSNGTSVLGDTVGTDMYFAGDGHSHWHVRDLATYTLNRLDNGVVVGTGAKHGFCFYDNYKYRLTLAGAPTTAKYTNCGTTPNVTSVTMGLSVGWGDLYYASLTDQYIDITGLKQGRYRLNSTVDANGWFREQNDGNNNIWTEIQVTNKDAKITAQGPTP
ncbi:lysyl oxidase family protein [Kocuria rosea]|uniref:lysyl oxidase family protein n=1 Tax=Kocuria rosea TaxID=1275 RepID=UPI0025B786C5|nr:lysyl oxidase family protein [Kocuria rosea]WJZ65503.1 lysyl oxidase family protein [Kocuria rosea]